MGSTALDDRRAGINATLTNISIGIPTDQELIGDRLLPSLRIPTSKADLMVWGTEAFRVREDKVGDWSAPDKLDVSVDKTTVSVDGHAYEAPVSDRHLLEATRAPLQYDLDEACIRTIRGVMDLARERGQAALLTSSSAYTATTHAIDLNGTEWNDNANDPFDDLIPVIMETIPNDSGRRPNTLWMSSAVWSAFVMNTAVKNRIFGTTAPQGIPTTAQVATLLGLQNIYIGYAMSKTAAGVSTSVWGDNAGLLYVPPVSGQVVPAFGYTVEQSVFGNASEQLIRIRDEHMGAAGGYYIKRSSFYTPVILFKDAGALFYNVLA